MERILQLDNTFYKPLTSDRADDLHERLQPLGTRYLDVAPMFTSSFLFHTEARQLQGFMEHNHVAAEDIRGEVASRFPAESAGNMPCIVGSPQKLNVASARKELLFSPIYAEIDSKAVRVYLQNYFAHRWGNPIVWQDRPLKPRVEWAVGSQEQDLASVKRALREFDLTATPFILGAASFMGISLSPEVATMGTETRTSVLHALGGTYMSSWDVAQSLGMTVPDVQRVLAELIDMGYAEYELRRGVPRFRRRPLL